MGRGSKKIKSISWGTNFFLPRWKDLNCTAVTTSFAVFPLLSSNLRFFVLFKFFLCDIVLMHNEHSFNLIICIWLFKHDYAKTTCMRVTYNMNFRKVIMHRDVTLLATKSSNKLKYLKLKERKNCKRSFYTAAKDISNYKF